MFTALSSPFLLYESSLLYLWGLEGRILYGSPELLPLLPKSKQHNNEGHVGIKNVTASICEPMFTCAVSLQAFNDICVLEITVTFSS